MNRKQFIESQGATCKNWFWSWSFINEIEKLIIFGEWDVDDDGKKGRIFSKDWEVAKGKRKPGYRQSREHIRLIEEEGYQLKTFPMEKDMTVNENDKEAPAKIKRFIPELSHKKLIRIKNDWYATD